jgi:hypothetical protein
LNNLYTAAIQHYIPFLTKYFLVEQKKKIFFVQLFAYFALR